MTYEDEKALPTPRAKGAALSRHHHHHQLKRANAILDTLAATEMKRIPGRMVPKNNRNSQNDAPTPDNIT